MEWWYRIIEWIPLAWTQPQAPQFMKNALLVLLITMPVLGTLGTLVVEKRMAFFSDAIGHGAFAGVALGSWIGLTHSGVTSLIFAVIFAALVTWLSHRARLETDTAIGALSAFFMALGFFALSLSGNPVRRVGAWLVGDILTVQKDDVIAGIMLALGVMVVWFGFYNRLFLGCVQRAVAISRGLPVLGLDLLFSAALAGAVTLSMRWLGLLMVNACLILPAAVARHWASGAARYQWFSAILALFAGIGGLSVSWWLGTPVGATVVLFLFAVLAITAFLKRD